MRILYIDMDSCRPDHLGCYGYARNTSPNIDAIAKDAAVFNRCYASDTPCLPSRTALLSGQFGFKTGVNNHSGEASFPRIPRQGGRNSKGRASLPFTLADHGYHTCFISPFIQRHSAWHTYAGFREVHDTGKYGHEIASETNARALPWVKQHAKEDHWFLHVNYWDPHRPYRTPMDYGNPFENDPAPAWPDQATIERHFKSYGPRSASEPLMYRYTDPKPTDREPEQIRNRDDFKKWIDGYDTGIRYMDDHIGQLLGELDAQGVLNDTAIVFSADHGEMQGELNVYGDHHCADEATTHVPLIVKWPGVTKPCRPNGLVYALDLCPTLAELTGAEVQRHWDGQTLAPALRGESFAGRSHLVLTQGLWTAQRSVRVDDWLMIRTFHPGLKPIPDVMLFNVAEDPHQTKDLAAERPDVLHRCGYLMNEWVSDLTSRTERYTDPMNSILRENGPGGSGGHREKYAAYLRERGMPAAAEDVLVRNPV